MPPLPRLTMRRYHGVLHHGGSLPMRVDTDRGAYVAKLRGAGHGAEALIAEIIATELARRAGLPVPGLAVLELGDDLVHDEGDPEILDLLAGSCGVNLGVEWLADARDATASEARAAFDLDAAADIVWLDTFVMNPDRTEASPNVLVTPSGPMLIDFGSALLFQHRWATAPALVHAATPAVADHLLLPIAGDPAAADRRMSARLDAAAVADAVAAVPDELLPAPLCRDAYREFLTQRLTGARPYAAVAGRANRTPKPQGRPTWISGRR